MLGGDGGGEFGHPAPQGVQRAEGGAPDGVLAGGRVLRVVGQPGEQRGDGAGGQQSAAAGRFGEFGDGEARYVAQSGLGEQGPVLAGDLGEHLVRHPVQDGDEGGLVLLGGAQEVPGDGVGVPRGGGDHHPDVGGADEFGGECPVVDHEGVDVGGVEDGEAARQAGDGLDPDLAGLVAALGSDVAAARAPGGGSGGRVVVLVRHPEPHQVGQYAHPGEPVVVVGVADEHRCAGGRAQHAGFADLAPHEGVDEGGLTGPGGPADHGEQGRLGRLQARYEVVVELRQQLGSGLTGPWGAGQGQRQTYGRDPVAQGGQGIEQLRPNIQGHHMRRMPNLGPFLKLIRPLRADRDFSGTFWARRTSGAQA